MAVVYRAGEVNPLDMSAQILPPAPKEAQEVLDKLSTYTKDEMIKLLDYWDLQYPLFYNKASFIFQLRIQMQLLKKQEKRLNSLLLKNEVENNVTSQSNAAPRSSIQSNRGRPKKVSE